MKKTAAAACLASGLVALAALSPRAIPYNMDEFVHYHALGCASAPLQRDLPSFRDGCGLYDLRLPYTRTPLPLRSYLYIGSFPAIPFYPFWRLLDDPLAVRVQGAVFFLIWLWFAARLWSIGSWAAVTAALAFPALLVTFIVDEGPVGLAAVLLTGALLALRRALARAGAVAVGWGAVAGGLLFLGLWSKLVFAVLLPAVAVVAWREGVARHGSTRRLLARSWAALAAAVLAAAVPSLVLLASVDVDGRPYAASLGRGRLDMQPAAVGARLVQLARVAVDPSLAAPRNVAPAGSLLDLLPGVLAAAVLAAGLRRGQPRQREAAVWVALCGLTLALLAMSAFSQWPHHAFYGLLLLVPALAFGLQALGPRGRGLVIAGVAVCWSTLALRWVAAPHPGEAAPAKDEMLRFVRESGLDRSTLQVHTSWGTYYVAQLFGDPDRMVVYLRAVSRDPDQLALVRDLACQRGRALLMTGSRRFDRFQSPPVTALIGEPSRFWRFDPWWAAEYAAPTSGCRRP